MAEHDGIETGTNGGSRVAGGNPSPQGALPGVGAAPVAAPAASVSSSPSVGATLRAGREQRGWSQEEVSIRLKFGVRQIAALEEERWANLPQGMSLRGFVRNYARILDLPAEPLLQTLAPRLETGDPVSLTQASTLSSPLAQSSGRAWPGASRRKPAPWIIGGLMVVVAIGLLAYTLAQQGKLPSMTSAAVKAKDAVVPILPAPSVGTVEEIAPPNTAPAGEPSAPTAAAPALGAPLVGAAPATPASPAAASPAAVPANAAGGLALHAREASWVEVRRANGSVAISQIIPAGGDFSLEAAAAPLKIVIGNAKGVDVSWRNAAVDLANARRDNVARLTLN